MDFITSDLHFSHKRIIEFCPKTRGHYRDVTHMNEDMIVQWNNHVGPTDHTYILGDVCFGNAAVAVETLNRLNGTKTLITGNHDRKLVEKEIFRNCFVKVTPYLDFHYKSTQVVMFHYPILEWAECHKGSVHLHGHLHATQSGLEKYRVRNVSFDCTGKVVSLLDNVIADALTGEIKNHH